MYAYPTHLDEDKSVIPGDIEMVKIIGSAEYDLIDEI